MLVAVPRLVRLPTMIPGGATPKMTVITTTKMTTATSAVAMDGWMVTSWETPAGIYPESSTNAPAVVDRAKEPTAHSGETNA